MNQYRAVLEAMEGRVMAVDRDRMRSLLAAVEAGVEAARPPMPQPRSRSGRVAVVPVEGVITHKADLFMRIFGGVSTEELGNVMDDLENDSTIDHIVLAFDSPGGFLEGTPELADKLFQVRERKNLFAVANASAYSAAYWLASQAGELSVMASGGVGSIGVYIQHTEFSELDKRVGIKTTIIKSGEFKAEANEFEPLAESAKENLQSLVDASREKFIGAVARGRRTTRGTVRERFGKGRAITAETALEEKMVDRIAGLQEVLAGLGIRRNAKSAKADLSLDRAKCQLAEMST